MCWNLGADYNADPMIPAQPIHGAKYKWGTGVVALSMADDQNPAYDAGNTTWWSGLGGTPPNTTADWNMSTANPCPTGYRVPTDAEWIGVVENNAWTNLGTWTNYSWNSGKKVGDALFLPAAGYRDGSSGQLGSRGSNGYYWSTTASSYSPDACLSTNFTAIQINKSTIPKFITSHHLLTPRQRS
jgi:hypothetical protein